MPRAVYRLYAVFEPKLSDSEAQEAVARIGAALDVKQLEGAVNRQSRLAARVKIEADAPEPAAPPPLLKDALKVADLRLRVGRGSFEAWNFASVHRQLAEAEAALANFAKYRLDEELRNSGLLGAARIDVSAELLASRGFFRRGAGRLIFLLLGALLGAAGVAAAAHQGVDVSAAIDLLETKAAEVGLIGR